MSRPELPLPPPPTEYATTVRLPDYYAASPQAWFCSIDATFAASRVAKSLTNSTGCCQSSCSRWLTVSARCAKTPLPMPTRTRSFKTFCYAPMVSAPPQITQKIRSANCKCAKCHICRRSANLTNYLSPQICVFAICRTYLQTTHLWKVIQNFRFGFIFLQSRKIENHQSTNRKYRLNF